ncbi:MAG TPA: hypothetical protein VMT87_13805 [Vicinamibacteria bacterium]|nr:hypothetical protein [Vicinamibacteria bacterium]
MRARDLLAALALAAAAWGASAFATRVAGRALVNFGPNDAVYVQGFRGDWEREGLTRFHWTSTSAAVHLPIHVSGTGHVLRMRVRRHFVEPARVTIRTEGRIVAAFDLRADERVPYLLLEFPLPSLHGRAPFSLLIDAPSASRVPLGIAMDWLEVERRGPGARFALPTRVALAVAAVALAGFITVLAAGGAFSSALVLGAGLVLAAAAGIAADPLAVERILREGWGVFTAVALVALLLVRVPPIRRAFDIVSPHVAGALVVVVLLGLAVRLALLLHPGFYYPDVRIHAMFADQVARHGLARFLQEFTASQFRLSLGLQFVNGHWYAFPYPPVFYLVCWPLVRLARYPPEVAVSVLAAALNSLEALLVYAIGRRLRLSAAVSMAAAAAHPLLPIFLARLSLAYFPALAGHFVDALVLLYLAAHLDELDRPRIVVSLGALVALALLTYTQSLLNFGILLPLLLAFQLLRDRTPFARRRQLGLAAAGALGALLSLALFYGRYVPVFLDMRRGIPMAEEQILLDKTEQRQRVATEETAPEEPDDPYAGPGLDLLRGARKAAWRTYLFYGGFAPVIAAGLVLLLRATEGARTRLVVAWASTFLLLNLASGGLPGPNLVRYNKDLEIVAPLFALALGAVGVWLATIARPLGLLYAASFWWFGAARAARYLTEKFVLER